MARRGSSWSPSRVAVWLVTAVVVSGCTSAPDQGQEAPAADMDDARSPEPPPQPFNDDGCIYLEALVTITAEDARSLLPDGYVPRNGLTGDSNTAIVFVPYLGCSDAFTLVGVTIEAPSSMRNETDEAEPSVHGYLLGTFVGNATGTIQDLLPGPAQLAAFSYATDGTRTQLEVSNDASSLSMDVFHGGRDPATSQTPFSIKLYHEPDDETGGGDAAEQTTSAEGATEDPGPEVALLTIGDLQRDHSMGTFQAGRLFGHALPQGARTVFHGFATDLSIERLH